MPHAQESLPLPPEEPASGLPAHLRRRLQELASGAGQPDPQDPAQATGRVERAPSFVVARLLAERGFWSLSPAAAASFTIDDLKGSLEVVPSAKGVSGMREAGLLAAMVSIWAEGAREANEVLTSYHRLAERLGWAWGGRTARDIEESLELLTLTGYRFVGDGDGRFRDMFTILQRVSSWQGPETANNRAVRVVFNEAIFDYLSDRGVIRPLDYRAMAALDHRQQLARRLLYFLDAVPAHRVEGNLERIQRIVDARLAHTLGMKPVLKEFRRLLARAAEAIVETSPRYVSIELQRREKRDLRRGDPQYLLVVVRRRLSPSPSLGVGRKNPRDQKDPKRT